MELLKLAGLQSIIPVIAFFTLLKVIYDKVSYIYQLNSFDKLFIPKNKVVIYDFSKDIFEVLKINIIFLVFSFFMSLIRIDSIEFIIDWIRIVFSCIFNITFLILPFIILYIKYRHKLKFIKIRDFIDDSKFVLYLFTLNLFSLFFTMIPLYYQQFKNSQINYQSVFVVFAGVFVVTGLYMFMLRKFVYWIRDSKMKCKIYKLKDSKTGEFLYVLKCKDENTLILGDSTTYKESSNYYLFNIKEDKYIQFVKED